MKSESQIQTEILKWLKSQGYLVIKTMSVTPSGIPDVICISPLGHHIYFEIKTDTGRLSPIQKAMHTRLESNGCAVHTVRSLNEVKEIIGEQKIQTTS